MGQKHVEHLESILEQHYKISMDWSGTKHVGLTLGCDYKKEKYTWQCQDTCRKHLQGFSTYTHKTTRTTLTAYTSKIWTEMTLS